VNNESIMGKRRQRVGMHPEREASPMALVRFKERPQLLEMLGKIMSFPTATSGLHRTTAKGQRLV
jgi:hypothetical protein